MEMVTRDNLSHDAASHPITHSEMQALLDPLHSLLQRMESTLCSLSSTVVVETGKDVQERNVFEVGLSEASADAIPLPTIPDDGNQQCENGSLADTIAAQQQTSPAPPSAERVQQAPTQDETQTCSDAAFPGRSSKRSDSDSGTSQKRSDSNVGTLKEAPASSEFEEIMKIRVQLDTINFSGKHGFVHKIATRGTEAFLWAWAALTEPERGGCLFRMSSSHAFHTWCMFVVLFNCGTVAYNVNWQIKNLDEDEPGLFSVLEICCICWFAIELVIRIGAHGIFFFVNREAKWNIFDFVLVCISAVDLFLDKLVGVGASGNVGFMRLLRLLKLARIMRAFRTFKFFSSLAQMLSSVERSLMSMFWGFIMLGFVLYLFSLVFMQAFVAVLQTDNLDPDVQQDIKSNFGSLSVTFLSLYMSVTGGTDYIVFYQIMGHAGAAYGWIFVFYTFAMQFMLFNILTGLLVEKAFVVNKPDRAESILRQRRVFAEQKSQFMEVCKTMDTNGDGKLTWTEFQDHLNDPILLAYMAFLGIDVDDVELFFHTCLGSSDSAKNNEVSVEQFVKGCMHMKGSAAAIDMQRLLLDTHCLRDDVKHLHTSCTNRFAHLERVIGKSNNFPQRTLEDKYRL